MAGKLSEIKTKTQMKSPPSADRENEMNNLNEKGEEMNNLNDKLGLQGKYRTIVHRAATGKVETSEWKVNTINDALKTAVAGNFETNADIAMNSFFDGNTTPPTGGEDGIMISNSGDNYYEMISSISGTGSSRKITGTFTGVADTFIDVRLGHDVDGADSFNIPYATPTAWDNVMLAAADTLTVEWTITVGA